MLMNMADKTGIYQSEYASSAGTGTSDPMYSIAESVRKVAGESESGESRASVHEPAPAPKKQKQKTEQKQQSQKKEKEQKAKTRAAPAKKTIKAAAVKPAPKPARISKIVEIQERNEPEEKKQKEAKNSTSTATVPAEDEFVEIKSDILWKISTIALAILVIWSYFFR